MNSFPRLLLGLARKDAAWVCSSCAQSTRRKPSTPFFKPSMNSRPISNSTKSRQNVAPTMEQLRAPFATKNLSTLYYTFSVILGTVAFSYGSVPMYKMVCYFDTPPHHIQHHLTVARSAKPQAGEDNRLKHPGMEAVMTAATLPPASDQSRPQNAYE